jgi:hemerythrin-like domain-containing protein
MSAGLPVLVSSTGELAAPARAIAIIRDEHRALAALLHAWMLALSSAHRGGDADVEWMRALVRHLQTFAAQLHHPKEQAHLFARLRERTESCHAELDELERQHERDDVLLDALVQRVEALAQAEPLAQDVALRALHDDVAQYARFQWEHMGREEGVILPAAQRHLTADDWAAIDAAFAAQRESIEAAAAALRRLLSRVIEPARV